MQTEAARPEAADLREYLGVIRRRKWSIILVTLVVVVAALAYAFRQTPQYTSESRVLITPTGPGATVTSINVANEQALAHSAAVASIVKTDLRSVRTVGSLLSGLHVAAEANTDILDFAYTSPAPPVSKVLAQGFADAYLKFRQQQANRQLSSQVAGLLAQINSTKSQLANVDSRLGAANNPAARSNLVAQRDSLIAQLGALQQQLESLKASVANQTGGQSVQDAALPVTPSSPNKVRDGALALFVGLALGVGVAFLRERLDDHLRGSEDLEAAMQAPVLAVIPSVPNWKDHELPELISIDAPRSASSEAYRTLRTNLQFVQHGEDVRVFIVTSGALGEGKTTTVANLGVALAQAGRRIVLVSCDLRRPRLHKFFDLQNETGLSSVLSGQSDLATAMQRAKNLDNVILLASGPIPPNPAELLASDRMRRVVDELRRAADFVIIDTPPLFAVSDALPLAALSDGAILVADAVATTRTAVRHARQQLDQVGARVLGGVLNNFDPYASRYSYSQDGYRYAYTYRYRDEDQPKRPGEDSKANGQSPNADSNAAAKGSGVEISSSENMWS